MQIIEGQRFAGTVLRRNRRLWLDFLGLALLCMLMHLLEILAAVVLLRIRQEPPSALLTKDAMLWRLVQLGWMIPAGLIWIFCSWTLWLRCTHAAGMLPQGQCYSKGKMLLLALQNTLLRTMLLQCVPLCLFFAYQLAETGTRHAESAPWLFGAVQLLVLAVLCFLLWIYVCLGLWCVPFVWFAHPEIPLWRAPFLAMHAMRGARKELLAMLGWYILQGLPVVTIPWILPRAGVAVTVFLNIRVRQAWENDMHF